MPDFTYSEDGFLVCIYPETARAIEEWNKEIYPKVGGKILAIHFEQVKKQFRKAGLTLQKAKKVKQSAAELLEDLGL